MKFAGIEGSLILEWKQGIITILWHFLPSLVILEIAVILLLCTSRKECFCSHKFPSIYAKAKEGDCSTPCSGNQSEICGGKYRLSVYDTGLPRQYFQSSINTPRWKHFSYLIFNYFFVKILKPMFRAGTKVVIKMMIKTTEFSPGLGKN